MGQSQRTRGSTLERGLDRTYVLCYSPPLSFLSPRKVGSLAPSGLTSNNIVSSQQTLAPNAFPATLPDSHRVPPNMVNFGPLVVCIAPMKFTIKPPIQTIISVENDDDDDDDDDGDDIVLRTFSQLPFLGEHQNLVVFLHLYNKCSSPRDGCLPNHKQTIPVVCTKPLAPAEHVKSCMEE